MIFLMEDTKLKDFMIYPRYLQKLNINDSARILYTMLLSRALLSRKNGWIDEHGRVYIYYPITTLAEDTGKGISSVKTGLNSLEKVGLILRVRQGTGKANRIYVLVDNPESNASHDGNPRSPDQEDTGFSNEKSSGSDTVGKPTVHGQNSGCVTVGKPSGSNNRKSYNNSGYNGDSAKSKNPFLNFEQRNYDFDQLERQLLDY